jgi:hypothetical protein
MAFTPRQAFNIEADIPVFSAEVSGLFGDGVIQQVHWQVVAGPDR